jgi:hypothetical protein
MPDFAKLKGIYQSVPLNIESHAQDEFAQFVEDRYYRMSYAKQPIRQIWQGTQDLYYSNDWEWIVNGEDFNKPIRFPTLRDFVKSLTDTFMQDPPDIELKEKHEDDRHLVKGKKAYIDNIRNSIHEKSIRRQVIEDMFFFGKGFREVSYWQIDKSGEVIFDDVATRRLDPRNVFVDENANRLHDKLGIDGARDMIIRDVIPYSTYLKMAEEFGWNLDVQPENWFALKGMDYLVTNARETQEKTPNSVVKLYKYINQEEGIYGITANGMTAFQGSLKEKCGTRKINVADYTYEFRNDSYWGNTLSQLIAPHIFLKDTLVNLEVMNLKLTLQPVVAVSGDFGFNRKIHTLQPGGVWQAQAFDNGKIQDKVMPLVFGNPNTKVYDMLQQLNSELTVTTRSDLRSLEFYKKKTATETMAQGQAQNAHNETIENINEVEAEAVLWEIALEIMGSFMDERNKAEQVRRIPIEGYAVKKNEAGAEFVRHVGYSDVFDLTQEMIDAEADVIVTDRRSEVARNAEKLGRVMQAIPLIGNFAQLDPTVLQKINFMGILEQLIEAVGMDIDRSLLDDESIYDDEFENLAEEIMLGHNVDLPAGESREDSLKRLRFLVALKKKEKFDSIKERAFNYHLQKTMENIVADHSKDVLAKEGKQVTPDGTAMAGAQPGQQQPGQQPGQPPMAQQNLPTGANPTMNQQGRPITIPQPDERMLHAGGPESLI